MVRRAFGMVALVTVALSAGCSDKGTNSVGCCPPDPTMSSCMKLGGYSPAGCTTVCDFYCSTNWRIEKDAHGCSVWRYDARQPQAGETPLCTPAADGGADSGPD